MTKKELPKYTKEEELFNAITHIIGAAFGVVALILGIVFGVKTNKNAAEMTGIILYGVSMILLYTMSSLYHFLPRNKAKRVFRIFDHCTIYLLIAGTYSPICLISLGATSWGIILFAVVWSCAIVGITFNAINMYWKAVKVLSMVLYLAMGWSVVFAIFPLLDVFPFEGFMWLLAGGIAYTVGVIFYAMGKKKKFVHGIWHLFCLVGTLLQFIAIFVYVINI